MADDQVKGAVNKAKGAVKETVGKASGDRSTELAGKADQAKGTVQGKIGHAKDELRKP